MKEKGIKILFSIFLFASVLMPFSVSADTITSSNIVGVERTLTNMELVLHDNSNFDKYNFIYNFEVLLDKSYVGWINISVGTQFTYSTKNGNQYVNNTGSFTTPSRTYYVNGNSFNISSSVEINLTPGMTNMDIDPAKAYNPTYTLNSSNVTELASIESLSDVIDILNDINQVVSIDILSELQSIVAKTDLSNNYLELIAQYSRFNIPVESLPANVPFMSNYVVENAQQLEILDFYQSIYHEYPIYKMTQVNTNIRFFYGYVPKESYVDVVIISNKLNSSWANSLFISDTVTVEVKDVKGSFNMRFPDTPASDGSGSPAWYVKRFRLINNTSSAVVCSVYWKVAPVYFIPIFVGTKAQEQNISTEFALNWGLTNRFLDSLDLIAQGTSQSNSAASELDQNTNQMQSDFNSYYSIENTANSDFNSALNGINFNDQIAGNQSFLDSASFVKTVFSSMMQIPILSTFVIILCIILMARIFL